MPFEIRNTAPSPLPACSFLVWGSSARPLDIISSPSCGYATGCVLLHLILGVTGLAELGAATYGGLVYGLQGFTIGWVVAVLLEAAILLPFVMRGGAAKPGKISAEVVTAR